MLVAAVIFSWSCERKGPDPEKEPEESEFYEFPLNVSETFFEASANGVTVQVTEVAEDNVVFDLIPGEGVKSYRLLLYPKALLYNYLLNEGCVEASQEVCEDVLIKFLSDGSSAPYVFNSDTDDFASKEFDWINTEYASGSLVPDCDYYIVVLGCYDDEGTNPASLSICSFDFREGACRRSCHSYRGRGGIQGFHRKISS